MKAITERQPWGSLIVAGLKPIENRSWKTNFRGRVLIHTSSTHEKGFASEILSAAQYAAVYTAGRLDALTAPYGAIIGSVEIIDCTKNTIFWPQDPGEIWAEQGAWHWHLANPIQFTEPFFCKGKQSLWEFPDFLLKNSFKGLPF